MISRLLFVLLGPPLAYILAGLLFRLVIGGHTESTEKAGWIGTLAVGTCVLAALLTFSFSLWSLIGWWKTRRSTLHSTDNPQAAKYRLLKIGGVAMVLIIGFVALLSLLPEASKPVETKELAESRAKFSRLVAEPLLPTIRLTADDFVATFHLAAPWEKIDAKDYQSKPLAVAYNRPANLQVSLIEPVSNPPAAVIRVFLDEGRMDDQQESHRLVHTFMDQKISSNAWPWIVETVNGAVANRSVVNDVRRAFENQEIRLNVLPSGDRVYGILEVSIFPPPPRKEF